MVTDTQLDNFVGESDSDFGKRPDGTQKGTGFLGVLSGTDAQGRAFESTEFSVQSDAVKVNGKRIDFPTLVSSLTAEEVELMMSDIIPNRKPIPEPIMQKAIKSAKERLSGGKSVFKGGPSTFSTADDPVQQSDITIDQIAGLVEEEKRQSPLSWIPPIEDKDKLSGVWTTGRIRSAQKNLSAAMGANDFIAPTEIEKQNRLNMWWRESGQFIPRNVLDQMGIIGGERIPTVREAIDLEDTQAVNVVKDFMGIDRDVSGDPLADFVIPFIDVEQAGEDPGGFEGVEPDVEMIEKVKEIPLEDLNSILDVINRKPLEFDSSVEKAVRDEIRIKETIPEAIEAVRDFPLLALIGTDFFNALAFNLPEFTSRKGFSPTEALLGIPKGDESIWIRAMARVREQVIAQDPTLLARIGGESGNTIASLIHFAALPNPAKLKIFASLPAAIKGAIGVGSKAGFLAAVQAPGAGETFTDRVESVTGATVAGAAVGAVSGAVFSRIAKAVNKVSNARFKAKFTQFKDYSDEQIKGIKQAMSDWAKIKDPADLKLWQAKHGSVVNAAINDIKDINIPAEKIKPVFRITPKGFRAGFAETGEPLKRIGEAAKKVIKKAPKLKEAAAIEAAKKVLETKKVTAKVLPPKLVSPEEAGPMKITFKETQGVQGTRLVVDPKLRKQLQTKENEIATLKTKRNELKAEKQFEKAKVKAEEIAKKEIALEALKEKSSIKLEQSIEGSKVKLEKIRTATEFKDSQREDAISMVALIPRELRPDFIKRAGRIGKASQRPETALKAVKKLTQEIQQGVDKFERRIETKGLSADIKKIESDNKRGIVRLGKIPSPQREQIIDTIDSIDLVKLSEAKETDLVSLERATKKLSSQLAGNLEALDDDVEAALKLPNERVRQLLRLSQKPVGEMDIEDIRLIRQSLKGLVHNAKLKGQLLTKQGFKPLEGAIKTVTQDEIAPTKAAVRKEGKVAKGEAVKLEKGKLQKTAEFGKRVLKLDDAHLDTLVQLSTNPDSPVTKQILDTDLHEGQRKAAGLIVDWVDRSAKRFEEIGFTDVDQIEKEVEVVLAGKKIKIEKDFLVKLELHSRSPENLKAILTTKGWNIQGVDLDYPVDAAGNDLIDRFAELKEALKTVREDPVLMGVADWTNELTPFRADAINEVSLILNGFEIARDPFYTSRPRSLPARVEGGKDISVPPEQQGRYLPRTGGRQRMKLERWSEDFLSGIESDAALQMAIPMRNARILVSSDRFQTAMKAAGRELELKNIITILRRTQGVTTSRSTLEVFGGKLQRGVTVSALGLRVSTIGTQAMSYPAFFAEVNPLYGRPLVPIRKGYISSIEEDSALMSLRWKGRRIGVEVGTSASSEAFGTMFFDKAKKISNKALRGLVFGDKLAFGNGHKAVVREILSATRNGNNVEVADWDGSDVADLKPLKDDLGGPQSYPTSKDVRFAAARRLEYIGRKTQPAFDMLDRSVSLSNPNVLERQLFIFRTALEAQENIGIRAVDAYAKSPKLLADKAKLSQSVSALIVSAFSVSVWKRGLKWAIATGSTLVLAAFGIFKFDDRKERQKLSAEVGKDTLKNIVRLNKLGKFAVSLGEKIADRVAGDGYNWNRNTFDLPVLDVLETGVDAAVAIADVIANSGLLDEFVDEVTKDDKAFNKQLEQKILDDVEEAIKISYEFGARISGQPILAPVQEFLRPFMVDSKIKIIREVTFGDVDSPQDFSERVFRLFELRSELNKKSKKKRLTRNEQQLLQTLDKFTSKANSTAEILKETGDQKIRALRFGLFQSFIGTTEKRVEFFQE